jgi:hypothetical protein
MGQLHLLVLAYLTQMKKAAGYKWQPFSNGLFKYAQEHELIPQCS